MIRRKLGTAVLFALGTVAFAPLAGAQNAASEPAEIVPLLPPASYVQSTDMGPSYVSSVRAQLTPRDRFDRDAHYFASTGGIAW